MMYDAIIVGGSFGGLATASRLCGYHVLLIDQHPIGSRQMSACGAPLATVRAVGAQDAVLEIHAALVMHTAGQEIRFPLHDPYATFDYLAFCQAMLARTTAEVWQTRVTGYTDEGVVTTRGQVAARFIVDAIGWRALHARHAAMAVGAARAGYGIETELPLRLDINPGLHFYVEKCIVRNGYAWVFPCGATTRLGVGAFEDGVRLRPLLDNFLARFGLQSGPTHGGVLAIGQREPIAGDIFVVGDAAGQCLPVTGEGIRTAIFHGLHCGQAIADALRGALTADEARARYLEQVHAMDCFHRRLLKLQTLVGYTPEPLIAAAGRLCARTALTQCMMRTYLTGSGWFLG